MSDERQKWLAGLQTFDKAWLPGKGRQGTVIRLVIMGDGRITEEGGTGVDLRAVIEPVPVGAYGKCPECHQPHASLNPFAGHMCRKCWGSLPSLCAAACRTPEEHAEHLRQNQSLREARAREVRGDATLH